MKWPRSVRLLAAWCLGDDDRRVPAVPEGLPAEVVPLVAATLRLLTTYQDAEYARLYLNRLGRFSHRRGVDTAMLGEIARLLAVRMAYQDLIWHAQMALAGGPDPEWERLGLIFAAETLPDPVRPTVREIMALFPVALARLVVDLHLRLGWADSAITLSLTARTWRGRLAANGVSSLRRLRPQSVRYLHERPLVERWLHMIDRALTKQPAAALEVIETAALLHGLGRPYRRALANWSLIIDILAKPTFDGALPLGDLAGCLARLRAIAAADPSGEEVHRAIMQIKAGLAHAA
ncbi:MAG: DUF6537 domain-containing protein [Pseudomonadota bacterium]